MIPSMSGTVALFGTSETSLLFPESKEERSIHPCPP
ncbi:unnamed protein product [Brassica rapa subsp. trilocularis]